MNQAVKVDVAIVGGGPAGSTVGTLLKKYAPHLKVMILEREVFPRDHVGESQLPVISDILSEMGVWEKVEEANFPVKIGATYKWGATDDLWDFNFIQGEAYTETARPGQYASQRKQTAFQVDRAIYDEILLNHAEEKGVKVRQGTRVIKVETEGDRITGLLTDEDTRVTAKYYIDASGHGGVLRRALGVSVNSPTNLQNIAIWDYYENAEWAVNIGVGGTRVQVMSLGYGWIWFIPLGPERTSIGLVVPASYYKQSGKKPAELFAEAIAAEPRISHLTRNAKSEGKLSTTKDWSFASDRMVGENWFLVGESAGFADPILAAGMTLAHQGAREAAYTIIEMERGKEDKQWLRDSFEQTQAHRLGQHIKFADYWYTANGHFSELKEFCAEIAGESGLTLEPNEAFRWLGTGGFVSSESQVPMFSGFTVNAIKSITQMIGQAPVNSLLDGCDTLLLDFEGAEESYSPIYAQGQVQRALAYKRNGQVLPKRGVYGFIIDLLSKESRIQNAHRLMQHWLSETGPGDHSKEIELVYQSIEAMVADGWIKAVVTGEAPPVHLLTPRETESVHLNRDPVKTAVEVG